MIRKYIVNLKKAHSHFLSLNNI